MPHLQTFFLILLALQLLQSIEKLSMGFHEKFPLGKMKWRTFLIIEIIFIGFWALVFLAKDFQYRDQFMAFFNVLMLANGVWEIVWAGIARKYVPGLIAAPFFIITFLIFYFKVLF